MSPTNETGPPLPPPQFTRPPLSATFLAVTLVVIFLGVLQVFTRSRPRPADAGIAASHEEQREADRAPALPRVNAGVAGTKFVAVEAALWKSPAEGPPLDLGWLPPGVQIVAAVRPRAILEHGEGEKVLAALGPLGERGIRALEAASGRPLADFEQLIVGWQTNQAGAWEAAIVATVIAGEQRAGGEGQGEGSTGRGAWEVYQPPSGEGRVLVVASPSALEEIKVQAGRAPPGRPAIQRLVDASDRTRDFTLLVAPHFLFGDGHTLFTGAAARLGEPLSWFLGDDLAAASLSMDWGQDFFVELRGVPVADVPTDVAASQLLERVRQLPEIVAAYIEKLEPHAYGRNVVSRLPAMVVQLAAHTRAAYDGDTVVLRAYLPSVAGHNLLLGAELALVESPQSRLVNQPRQERARLAASIAERLERRTTLRFPRDTLETALDMLAQDLGVEIILLGSDLQLEGITKNQSLAIDLADRPGGEILVEILRQANPDKSASGPADERQRLLYVIKPRAAGQEEAIFVTTRSQALRRGDRLPAVFMPPEIEQPAK